MKRKTTEQFIADAIAVHGDKYDYSLVNYINAKTKVDIKCKRCGKIFPQVPYGHLKGQGCPDCNGGVLKTKEQFIEEAKLVHGDNFDYSLVEYVNWETKIKIKCNICKEIIEQTPNNHLQYGCKNCQRINRRSNTEQFIEKAKLVHGDDYDYSLVEYKNNITKVNIKCKCGRIFPQRPNDHLNGQGCIFCNKSKGEKRIQKCLEEKKIEYEFQKKFDDLKDVSNLSYDFYIPSKNLLIEYNGIQHYERKHFKRSLHDWHRQLHHDWLKRKYAKDKKINLLVIPYWEFKSIEKSLEKNFNL